MTITYRPAQDAEWDALCYLDGRSFGMDYSAQDKQEARALFELERGRVALDGDERVGMGLTLALEVTLPGGASLPATGLTWCSVATTHRRQGIFRRLLEDLHEEARARGEALSLLGASEGGIYGRFGYGVVTQRWETVVDRRRARLRRELPARERVRFVPPEEVPSRVEPLWERYRRGQPGEVARSRRFWDFAHAVRSHGRDGATPVHYLAHPEGYVAYRQKAEWTQGLPADPVRVVDLVALSPEAHLALWGALLELDLCAELSVTFTPPEELLPWLLENPRELRTRSLADHLWARVLDVPRCFEARAYAEEGSLVLGVGAQRYALEVGPQGARCVPTQADAELTVREECAGPLLFGAVTPGLLARARRAEARSPEALRRAERLFAVEKAPFSQTGF